MLMQWQASTGHRDNVLMTGARRVGVAFANNANSPYHGSGHARHRGFCNQRTDG
jgi:hypothetical protein